MVKETRIVFEVKDIIGIRIRCNECLGEVVLKLPGDRIPSHCPICERLLVPSDITPEARRKSTVFEMVHALRVWSRDTNAPVTVFLEFDGDEAD